MAVSVLNKTVEIGGVEYHLDIVPTAESTVVAEEKEQLLSAVDLKTLVNDLRRVGAFIRIAYNGVGAAGPKFTQIQIDIQDLGYDVAKLCDKSALTVSKFKHASATVLTDLQATYEYLLDNLEEMAVETLSSISKTIILAKVKRLRVMAQPSLLRPTAIRCFTWDMCVYVLDVCPMQDCI